MSGLIWVKTVCNDYQLTTLVGKELNQLENSIGQEMDTKQNHANLNSCNLIMIFENTVDPDQLDSDEAI